MEFESYRPLLFSIAYRMLGSVADAEDMVQETWLRLGKANSAPIENPRAYLCTIVTHLCIDHLRSARTRHEVASGTILPEPMPPSFIGMSTDSAILAESLSIAFLTMLQSLAPLERAVFILREVFDFDYEEVARIVGKTPVNCRQLVARARKSLGGARSRFEISPAKVRYIVEQFLAATRDGDLSRLLELLAPDVTLYADGGPRGARYGAVKDIRRPLCGSSRVAKFLIASQAQAPGNIMFEIRDLNLSPAIVSYLDGKPLGAVSFDIAGSRIRNIFILADQQKLRSLSQ